MGRWLFFTIFLLFNFCAFAQRESIFRAIVVNANNKYPMPNVQVLNLDKVLGAITDKKGSFKIKASVNDTVYVSYLGYKSIKINVTNDMLKYGGTKIELTELAYALEKVVVHRYNLTGYLDIDVRNIPVTDVRQYRISGLPLVGYEAGNYTKGAFSKVVSSIFNPADFLYNTFGRKGRQLRKLKKMRKQNQIRKLLADKFDRETLVQFLKISKEDLENILIHCNYSKAFVMQANDLQILEALSNCYEEYKMLKN